MNKKHLSLTVGIPTCYGGESLVRTAQSIMASVGASQFRFIVVADRTPIKEQNREKLRKMGVELYWNKKEGSQFKKIKQIVSMCQTDLLVTTQDDVIFDRNTLSSIVSSFQKNPEISMVGVQVLPLEPRSLFESVMNVEMRIHDRIARQWKNANNYFAASGRCLAFRTSFIKRFRIPESIINGDTYLYLENKRVGGAFLYQPRAVVRIRSPLELKDQVGPSSRFQYSHIELSSYFPGDLTKEYRIPVWLLVKALLQEFIHRPLHLMVYTSVFAWTRIKKQRRSVVANPVWNVDISTKNLT